MLRHLEFFIVVPIIVLLVLLEQLYVRFDDTLTKKRSWDMIKSALLNCLSTLLRA